MLSLGLLAFAAYLFVVPALFAVLAWAAWDRDPTSARWSLVVAVLFLLQWAAIGPLELWPGLPPVAMVGIGLLGIAALVLRLRRDKRQRHVRSTLESLAVLLIGLIYLLTLMIAAPLVGAG